MNPNANVSPGDAVWPVRTSVPSVVEGSVHETAVELAVDPTETLISLGQSVMTAKKRRKVKCKF